MMGKNKIVLIKWRYVLSRDTLMKVHLIYLLFNFNQMLCALNNEVLFSFSCPNFITLTALCHIDCHCKRSSSPEIGKISWEKDTYLRNSLGQDLKISGMTPISYPEFQTMN